MENKIAYEDYKKDQEKSWNNWLGKNEELQKSEYASNLDSEDFEMMEKYLKKTYAILTSSAADKMNNKFPLIFINEKGEPKVYFFKKKSSRREDKKEKYEKEKKEFLDSYKTLDALFDFQLFYFKHKNLFAWIKETKEKGKELSFSEYFLSLKDKIESKEGLCLKEDALNSRDFQKAALMAGFIFTEEEYEKYHKEIAVEKLLKEYIQTQKNSRKMQKVKNLFSWEEQEQSKK